MKKKSVNFIVFLLLTLTFCDPKETQKMDVKLVLDVKAQLGEGPIWNHELNQLYWIDIEKRNLYIFTPKVEGLRSYPTKERIGTVVPIEKGGALVALQNGIFSMDLATGDMTLLSNPLDSVHNIRFNDGKCDPVGRFWVGTMDLDSKKGAASLFMMNDQHQVKKMLDHVTISNGVIWSLDQKTMYYIDTPTRQIKAFDYDVATGNISSPNVVVTVPEGEGSPDGMTIDEEGKLWVGLWGGAAVARFDPDTGELMQKIEVPAINVTACAFGGDLLDNLYITTASVDMNDEQKKKYPNAGGLFAVKPGVKGVPADFYKDNTK